MRKPDHRSRRRFLESMGVPAALVLGRPALGATRDTLASPSPDPKNSPHCIDLGLCETVAVADMNGDGRLDIVSGENWF